MAGAVNRCGRNFHARAQRRAEQAGEFQRRIDRQSGRERCMPGQKFLGEIFGNIARPFAGVALPHEAEIRKTSTRRFGCAQIKLQSKYRPICAGVERQIWVHCQPAAGPLLLATGLFGRCRQLRVEMHRLVFRSGFAEPAFQHGAKRDAAHFHLERGRKPQPRGAEAAHNAGIAERGRGQLR